MKALLFFLLSIPILAQNNYLIQFEKTNIQDLSNLSVSDRARLENSLAKPNYFELWINNKECTYKEVETVTGSNKTYYYGLRQDGYSLNFDQNVLKVIQDLNGKLYLQRSEIDVYDWKIEEETKSFLNYKVQKAILDQNDFKYMAWFTNEIPSRCGPELYGLPGTILELSVYNKDDLADEIEDYIFIRATKIQPNVKKGIKLPKIKKVLSKAEFEDIYKTYRKKVEDIIANTGVDKE